MGKDFSDRLEVYINAIIFLKSTHHTYTHTYYNNKIGQYKILSLIYPAFLYNEHVLMCIQRFSKNNNASEQFAASGSC